MVDPARPKLLSSGNPQIPKGDGPEVVSAYLDAMPDWKSPLGHEIDRLVCAIFPEVRKAVRWNTPLYGKEDGWFLSLYCYKHYVQLSFFRGVDLVPQPCGESKSAGVRHFNIREGEPLDRAQLSGWIAQAVTLPGVALW